MGKVRYLGSKARLVSEINEVVGKPKPNQKFIELFSGTGIVSHSMGVSGWDIEAFDTLKSAVLLTVSKLVSNKEVNFSKVGGYSRAISHLNNLNEIDGFFFREYSNSEENKERLARPYFTINNAKKIDAIRAEISTWYKNNQISELEKSILLADLIEATNQIANIAGTYGCFLKNLSSSAKKPITLTERVFLAKRISWNAETKNAFDVSVNPNDVVYIDPPYTKRQYAAYYHIPETIAHEDEPLVKGITGLRPWKEKSSIFCYKQKAGLALEDLLSSLNSKRILISYSSDGHIAFEQLMTIAKKQGDTILKEFDNFKRYSPNQVSLDNSKKNALSEYLIEINR